MTPDELYERIAQARKIIGEYLDEERPLELLSESITLLDTLLYDLAQEIQRAEEGDEDGE